MTELSEELRSSQKNENHLTQDNRSLREKLEAATKRIDEVESQAMDADEILKTKIETQNETINQLQQRLYEAQVRLFLSEKNGKIVDGGGRAPIQDKHGYDG